MKKFCVILLSAITLLFTACDSWMQQDDFYSDIENDVKVANATQISVYVRYAMTRQGKTDPEGPTTFKVEIPQNISATTEPEYGFVRWAAFSTDFLATGDNQSKNKDVYFVDDEDYNTRLRPYEIQSPVVVFENAESPSTSVTINEARNDIFLVPIVAQRPSVSLTIPAKGSSGVVRNMSVRINFSKPMDPESFKNEDGVFDKIQVTQGIQSFTADGDIEINSEDITNRFSEPVFSKNKRMVTLKFKPEEISEGYSSQSSVNITVSKDVKDLYGFTMTDDDKISFTVGSYKDTLAPRITQLTAGRGATDFHKMQGMYKDEGTINSVGAVTKMTLEGALKAPKNNIDASFYDGLIANRITGKVIIRVLAEDVAGSGTGQSQTGIETDVAMIGVRAYHMYNADGTPSDATIPLTSYGYVPQTNLATSIPGAYKTLIDAINAGITDDDKKLANDKGCIFEYDVSSLPDGLIRIDVAAVDMVQNSGFADGGEYSEEYGNGYASLFVVKDTTPPDAQANSKYINVDTGADSHITADNYFNEVTYSRLKIKGDTSSISDSGHPRLGALHDSMKWIVKPTAETSWVSSVNINDSAWGVITSNYGPFPLPRNEGEVHYTYALMDDVGNISSAVAIPPIYYDSVAPVVQNPYLIADEGFTAGVAKDNVLDEQTLVVPIKEITSGLKSIEVKVRKNGDTVDYATPLADASLVVKAGGENIPYTIDSAKKTITFSQPITNFDSTVTIKGIKLSNDNDEQGSFEIKVNVKDAAAADSVHETISSEGAVSNTDSVPVEINQIYIPNIRKTERTGSSGVTEYWIDYNASSLIKKTDSNPLTDVYISFTEATSGAKVFDFAGSSIKLTAESKIYKINSATGTIDGIAIGSTVDTAANKLTITSSVDAATYFAGGQITVKITNVQLAAEGTASTVALRIHDTATNPSNSRDTICSNEGSLNLINPGISTSGFKFDSTNPTTTMTHGNLADRNGSESASTAAEAIGKTAAETGYTNEDLINATVTLHPGASGISSLRISGDAEFISGTTTIKADGNNVSFDISSAGKVVTFKNANGHLSLGSGATAVTLTINNLKITTGDGTKNVNFFARSFGNVEGTAGSSDSIILDTQAPTWTGIGLYVTDNSNVTSAKVYPHPVSNSKVYGLTNIDSANPDDIYFYTYEKISIKPDVSDSANNLKAAASLIDYTHNGSTVTNNNAAYSPDNSNGYTTQTGTFTATAKDKAGNKSTVKTFHIVPNAPFTTDENSDLDNYMVLYKPEGSFIHRNTSTTAGIVSYVIKGDSQYQIRIKLGGVAAETGEELLNGSEATIPGAYGRTADTTDKPKIDKFYISTSTNYNTNAIVSPTYNSTAWKNYTTGTYNFDYNYTDSVVTTASMSVEVDDAGTIIINLPDANCDPIVLHLMDGCGNITSRRIRPASMSTTNNAILWAVDSRLGAADAYVGKAEYSYPSDVYTSTDVTFYNSNATLTLKTCSDLCRFDDPGVSTATDIANGRYTMKSRILVWPANAVREPVITDFYDDTQVLSDWYGAKEARNAGSSTAFDLSNNFPTPDTTTPYKLYYIIQDTVGNKRIEKITRSNKDLWLFDNTKPTITNVQTAENINTINGKNYYSDMSFVTYTVNDAHSGIKNDGRHSDFNYTSFAQRKTSQSITYELNGIDPESEKLVIASSSVKDWAGNGLSADVELTYGGTDKWVRQYEPPEWSSENYLSVSNALDTNWGLSTTTDTSDSSCIAYNITSKAYNSEINVKFTVTDSDLLGWIITETALTKEEKNAFCDKNDNRLKKNLVHSASSKVYIYTFKKYYDNGFADRYTAWHSKYQNEYYFYPVNKAGLICSKPVKVNFEENLIPALKDDLVHYDNYVSPTDSVPFPTTGTITTYGTGAAAVNYTKTGASIKFSTTNNPNSCWIIYGAGTDNDFGTDDDAHVEFILEDYLNTDSDKTTYKYKIPLDYDESSTNTIKNLSAGTLLKLRLSRTSDDSVGEDSVVTDLVGPANNNKWTFDETAPAIKFTTSDVKTGVTSGTAPVAAKSVKFTAETDSDNTLYIQSEKAILNLSITASESSTSAPNDIAHYQWKVGNEDWTDIPNDATTTLNVNGASAGLSFKAPDDKTTYQFRVIDKAGNISEAHLFSTADDEKINEVTLQRDEWAPTGTFDYDLTKDSNSRKTALKNKGLDSPFDNNGQYEEPDENDRVISYSAISSSEYYIDTITLDLSKITDAVNNKPRSGIQKYLIESYYTTSDNTKTTLDDVEISAQSSSYPITLPTPSSNENSINPIYTYIVKVIDNLNQSNILQTFRTQADNQAPALTKPEHWIQATKEGGSAVTDAVLDNGTYWLMNDKTVITFKIDDNSASYTWSNTGNDGDWHESDSVVTVTKSYPYVTYTFAAPDESTVFYFKAEDSVFNKTKISDIKVQKDKWAPDVPSTVNNGLIAYTLYNSTTCNDTTKKTSLTAADGTTSLITESGNKTNQDAAVEIKYSSNPSANSKNYLKTMIIDLSAVTDDVAGIPRSGFEDEDLYVSIDGGAYTAIGSVSETGFSYSPSTKKITLTLPDDSDTIKSYTIKVKDNIGQERVLRTFTLKPDGTKPDLELKATDTVLTEAEGNVYHNSTYYVKGTNAIVNFTKTASNTSEKARYAIARYEMKESDEEEWTNIPIANNSNLIIADTTVSYTLPAPESAKTYQFHAIDEVGNISTTQELTIVQDITAPQGTAGEPQFGNANGAVTTGFVKTVSDPDTKPTEIAYLYNSNTITTLTFSVDSIAETAGGSNSGFDGYFLNDSDTALTATSSPVSISENNITIALVSTSADTAYVIKVKDKVGNSRTLYTFHFTADGDAPDFTLKSVQTKGSNTVYDVEPADDGVYYLKRANAIINFETTTPIDIDHYEWDNGTGIYITAEPITLTNMSYTFTAPDPVEDTYAPTTYKFRAVDAVGNVTEIDPVKLVHDETAPNGSITEISLKDQNGTVFTDTLYYKATTPEGSTTTSITYNSNQVKSITFTDSGSDNNGGSGYDNTTLWYKVDNENDTHAMENKTLTLSSELDNTTYHIIAKDKVGNKKEIWTYVFTADGTAPSLASNHINATEDGNVNKVFGYTAKKANGDPVTLVDNKIIPVVHDNAIGDSYDSISYDSGMKIYFSKDDITGALKYKFVVTDEQTSNEEGHRGYNATASATESGWKDMALVNNDSEYEFEIPDITTIHAHLALFFMDEIGNVSPAYYIGNMDSKYFNRQWWILDNTLTEASQISVTNPTWNHKDNEDTTYSNISVSLPNGTILHTIAAENATVTSVTLKYKQNNQDKNKTFNSGFDSIGWVYISGANDTAGMEINLTVSKDITDSSSVKLKINDVSQKVFTSAGNGNPNVNGSINGGVNLSGGSISDTSSSRVSHFFNNVANIFVRDTEVSFDNSVTETPVESANKAAKKAAKKAKKTAKASAKVISKDSTTAIPATSGKQAMAVEAAEIVDQTVTEYVPEITAVTEKVNSETEVISTITPAAETVTATEITDQAENTSGKSSSKSAVIVIMLAILSSFAGAWYYKKSRK